MNASWRKKSANIVSLAGWSGWSRATLLVMLFGTATTLAAGYGNGTLIQSLNASFRCEQSAPLNAVQADDTPIVAPPKATTIGRVTYEMKSMFVNLLTAEQRRVCAWKRISQQTPDAPLVAFACLIAITGGSVGLARPFVALLSPRRRISARLTAAAPRHNNDDRFDQCFAGAVGGMMLVHATPDGDFVCIDMNAAWQNLVGETNQVSVGGPLHQARPAPIAGALLAKLRECVADGQSLRFQQRAAGPSERDVLIIITPVRDLPPQNGESGPIQTLLCQAYDDTVQVQLAAHMQHEQRMETVRRLAAGVAHDFNNLLQAICGGLELIIDESETIPSTRELATIALGAAQRGSHLTQHLLSYARRQVLSPQPIDLREFLPRIRVAIEQALGSGNHLELAFVASHCTIFADETNLRTALINLAFNAGRAMPNGGRLLIETSVDSADRSTFVRILVSDNGAGMDAATLARCDEPFFTTKGATGTGLGLSMVQGFAVQSGGTLHLSSIPGQGTCAVLTLPACHIPAIPDARQTQTAYIGRVLLVDDATDVLVTTGCMLQRAGFHVTPVQSGDAALAQLAAGHAFDVLVTDYAMPGLSGVELIRLAREMRTDLAGLIITGFHEVNLDLVRETANVLRKPFQRQELLNAVQEQIHISEYPQSLIS